MSYPTVTEALSYRLTPFRRGFVQKGNAWKKLFFKGWKNLDEADQMIRLVGLGDTICSAVQDIFSMPEYEIGGAWTYTPKKHLITMKQGNPSIISLLHEIGHHLYGNSELYACAFSLQLFKKTFPKDFEKLKADGHLMKRQ